MTGFEVILPYVAAASAVNTLYGAVTGTPGGLIGEIFADDPPARAPAPAPTPAPAAAPAAAAAPAPAPVQAPSGPPTLTSEQLTQSKTAIAQGVAQPQYVLDQLAAYEASQPATALPSISPPPVATTAIGGAAPSASTLEAPKIEPPAPMPVASQVITPAKRASLAEQRRRAGRASTILTSGLSTDRLGA